jgi:hypothetical protein
MPTSEDNEAVIMMNVAELREFTERRVAERQEHMRTRDRLIRELTAAEAKPGLGDLATEVIAFIMELEDSTEADVHNWYGERNARVAEQRMMSLQPLSEKLATVALDHAERGVMVKADLADALLGCLLKSGIVGRE